MFPTMALLLVLDAGAATPPSGLTCLARYYAVVPEMVAQRWYGRLPDGTRLVWDDGRKKTFDEVLAAPDLQDMFSIRYRAGPIRPVDGENDDPGRIRVESLFAATYGASAAAVQIVSLVFLGKPLKVNRRAQAAFARVSARLETAQRRDATLIPYLQHFAGTFVWRKIAGTDRQSAHSYGVSLDLDTSFSHYWRWQKPRTPLRWQNRIPQAIVDAFEAEGFIWGGRWYHYDTMHFEYRPELLDPACAES